MVDADLIHKKIAFIETCVRELREIADPSRLGHDVREERFITHTLQLAIQAALDIASHVVSARRFGEPTTNRNLFDLLEREQWIPAELAARLRDMAGFRNVVVHGYESVDLAVVCDILDHRLGDLLEYCGIIRGRVDRA